MGHNAPIRNELQFFDITLTNDGDVDYSCEVRKGDLSKLPANVKRFVKERAYVCHPKDIFICDGSEEEYKDLVEELVEAGALKKLGKYENSYLAFTDPADVARVEKNTIICTSNKQDTMPINLKNEKDYFLGHYMSPDDLRAALLDRFPGCMKGRTMYVIPFSMGHPNSPVAKFGIELTDSPYVVACMHIMTRVGTHVLEALGNGHFVRGLHSVGQPLPLTNPLINNWPCNPGKVLISHIPENDEICSFGSGYGGNSLLGKKCFALRIGSILGKREGWLAEHMLITGITNPKGETRYVVASFPSACGKTNMAMLQPTLPGYKVSCVGDDICWMFFDDSGQLRAINPENGFFGVCPGTNMHTNPNAMLTCKKNTIFTNVAYTSDGGVWWEGIDEDLEPGVTITSWEGIENWTPSCGKLAAHPNSRFCCPAIQCPIIDPKWENPEGVPIDAIIFGGRRPRFVPLIYEALNWEHGVLVGACMKSEATSASDFTKTAGNTVVMHDPFGMRPFFGYNPAQYMQHWLNIGKKNGAKLPKIFHVNWFRKDENGKFMWPGFGDNIRVLDWVMKRCGDDESVARETPIGFVPLEDSISVSGLDKTPDFEKLFYVDRDFWKRNLEENRTFLQEQLGSEAPDEVFEQLEFMLERL